MNPFVEQEVHNKARRMSNHPRGKLARANSTMYLTFHGFIMPVQDKQAPDDK